ncbi:MAG: efflux RND transporter periplasmic adaptor subunit [Planctomycetaceae bacterium]|nr:efflux RND transporter periplasmic adaptor subunit [Planctomycetaceae bacterium]
MNRYIIFLSLLTASLWGCSKTDEPQNSQTPTANVSTSPPAVRSVSRYAEVTGRTEASAIYEARARVPGTLISTNSDDSLSGQSLFAEGKQVDRGDKLFEIEPETYVAAVDAALAKVEVANARVESAKAQAESAKSQLSLADKNYLRAQKLFEKMAITQSELDEKEAELNVAKATASQAVAVVSQEEAAVSQAKATLEQAQIDLSYTTITSPIQGLAGEKLVDEGNIVGVGEFTLLTTIRKTDPLHIYFDAPEQVVLSTLRKLSRGESRDISEVELEIGFEGETGYPHSGQLQLIDNQIDPNTGTSLLRGTMPNPDFEILPGAYARIRIKTEPIENAVLVSEIAINTDLSGKYLLVVNDDNIIEQYRVRLGQTYEGFRHITAMWKFGEAEPKEDDNVPTNFEYIHAGLLQARPGMNAKVTQVPLTYPEVQSEDSETEGESPSPSESDSNAESPAESPPEKN